MDRYICIHGHFYQPPRENPWLEEIEPQDSAHPFENWNERVSAECYEPNTTARILDDTGRIRRIINNYARISYNFGPTLLHWLERKAPEVYSSILEADRLSAQRFGGHGSALAMPFNHMIMPLANQRDRITQIAWGLRDFERRFGRKPEGMWLPETAVDLETLRIMAGEGIRFTILAPHQAGRVRRGSMPGWRDVSGAKIDPSEPYRVNLGGHQSIAVFFYDGPVSSAVAFENLLQHGEDLVTRLIEAFPQRGAGARLVSIATDGESYGHHHRFGEMALAYALYQIEQRSDIKLTNYGEFLDLRPPTLDVEIVENSSWSCAHGVERWQSDCGCNTGTHPGWKQQWRGPMRRAMDALRDAINPDYEAAISPFVKDPWDVRNAYVEVVLDSGEEKAIDAFLEKHASAAKSAEDQSRVLGLLELQRHLMYMYTSCGWFFDDISGIEAVQCLRYADRALQLAEERLGRNFDEAFLQTLQEARSNLPDIADGAALFRDAVRPARVDLHRVGAHFVVWSLFEPEVNHRHVYAYELKLKSYKRLEDGTTKLVLGSGLLKSRITREEETLAFSAFYFGGHSLNAAVSDYPGEARMAEVASKTEEVFSRGDYAQLIRLLDEQLGCCSFSLESLFRTERRKVIEYILQGTLAEAERAYRDIYERNASFMRFLAEMNTPPPPAFRLASEYVLTADIDAAFSRDGTEPAQISRLLEECRRENIDLESNGLTKKLENSLVRHAIRFRESGQQLVHLQQFRVVIILARAVPLALDFSRVQNIYYRMISSTYAERKKLADRGEAEAVKWVELFRELGEDLSVRIE